MQCYVLLLRVYIPFYLEHKMKKFHLFLMEFLCYHHLEPGQSIF